MGIEFVKTQVTLLQRIAAENSGEDESVWARFFELYYPAMTVFARDRGAGDNAEDVASEVLVKLVDVLRNGRYERREGVSFRSYVKKLIRNQLNDLYRKEKVRGLGRKVELTENIADGLAADSGEVGDLDREWARACRKAALEHVFTQMAISEQSKAVYREYVIKDRPIGEVAKEFGLSRNSVSQIKTRIERTVTAIATEYMT